METLKADPKFKDFNDYFPCKLIAFERIQQLRAGLEGIPGSAEHAPVSQQSIDVPHRRNSVTSGQSQNVGDDGRPQELPGNINLFMIELITDDEKIKRLEEWFKNFTSSIDIDRIARLAIWTRSTGVVDFLVTHRAADLKRKDIMGRSAVFYAVATKDLAMLHHVADVVGQDFFRAELTRADAYGRTPVHYVATTDYVELVEYCLAMANSDHSDPAALTEEQKNGTLSDDARQQVSLLIMAKWRLQRYRDLPICAMKCLYKTDETLHVNDRYYFLPRVFKIDDLQNESKDLGEHMKQAREKGQMHWLHIPWTNGLMLFTAFRAIERDITSKERLYEYQPSLLYRSSFLNCFSDDCPTVPGDPNLNYWKPNFSVDLLASKAHITGGRPFAFAVFPCLVLRSKGAFTAFRDDNIKLRDDIEIAYAKNYIHLERSLDEAYYPSLKRETLDDLNKDQVVSKECKYLLSNKAVSDSTEPILMVSQLWIWKCDNHLLSAYSVPQMLLKQEFVRANESGDDLADEMDIKFWEFNESLAESTPEVPPLDQIIGFILAHHIDKFGRPQENRYPSPLDIFATGVVRIMSDVEAYMTADSLTDLDMARERQFIHDNSDIRNELAMVDDILSQQSEVLESLIAKGKSQKLLDAKDQLSAYRKRKDKISADAERISQSIQDQLDLKRTNASMVDARVSQRDAHTSLLLSTAVIGFTIITIIFAPIAFMTSLFALPIDSIVKHQTGSINGTSVFSTNYIGKWFVTAEIASIAVTAIAVALSLWLVNVFGDAKAARSSKKDPASKEKNIQSHLGPKGNANDSSRNKKETLDIKQQPT